MEDLRPTPSCSCAVPCTCDLSKVVHNFKQMEYITCFLKVLNNNYQNTQMKILRLDNFPPISHVYSLIAQQEVAPNNNSINLYATSNINGKGRGNTKPSMVRTNCSKTNHIMDTCYFKHGFPLGYRIKNPKNASKPKTSQPTDAVPNISKEDYQYLLQLLQQSRKDQPKYGKVVISGMINSGSNSNSPSIWILDSGASNHVCPDISCFADLVKINPV